VYLSVSAQGKRGRNPGISHGGVSRNKKAGKMPAAQNGMQYYLSNIIPEIRNLSREIRAVPKIERMAGEGQKPQP
jgi:hypothetical protein